MKIIKNIKEASELLSNYKLEEKDILITEVSTTELTGTKFGKLILITDYLEKNLFISKNKKNINLLETLGFKKFDNSLYKREFKQTKVINVPEVINHSIDSFNFLLNLAQEIKKDKENILLSFKETAFFSSDQCGILGGIILPTLKQKKCSVGIFNYSEKIEKVFKNNHFSETFGISKNNKKKDDTIIYICIDTNNLNGFENYINDYLIKKIKKEVGSFINEVFLNELKKVLRELFINVQDHTSSNKVYLCGQFVKNKNILFFSFVNFGETIVEKVEKNKPEIAKEFRKRENRKKIIEWTLGKGNTTKSDCQTGGLGLAKLTQFMEKTIGSFIIVSDKEFYKKNYGKEYNKSITSYLKNPLEGTAVILKIDFANEKYQKNFVENKNEIIDEYKEELF